MAATLTEAAADAIGRAVAAMQREFRQAEELREAKLSAKLAEIDAAELRRDAEVRKLVEERLASVRDGRDGLNGASVTIEDVKPIISVEVERAVASIPVPKDGEPGTSVSIEDIAPLVRAEVETAVLALPPAQDGKDADPELIRGMVAEAAAAIPAPQNGKDADPEQVAALVASEVEKAFGGLPVPKDGAPGEPGPPGRDGRDGAGALGAVIDRSGALIMTFSDGTVRDLGIVVERSEASPSHELSDDEFQRRVELATGPASVASRFAGLRQSAEARNMQALMGAFRDARQAVNVSVTLPKQGKEITKVLEHDKEGRILKFEKTPVDEAVA